LPYINIILVGRGVIMRKIMFVIGLVMFMLFCGCLGPGSGTPEQSSDNVQATDSAKFVMFVSPNDHIATEMKSRVAGMIDTDIEIETRCVDLNEVLQGTPSDAQTVCMQQNPDYAEDVNTLKQLLNRGENTLYYYYDNKDYYPVKMSLNPVVTANDLCTYINCNAPEVVPFKMKVYIINEDDKNRLAFFDSLAQYGMEFEYDYVIFDDTIKQKLIENYGFENVPVFFINKSLMDDNNLFVADVMLSQLMTQEAAQQTGWKLSEDTDLYYGEPVSMTDAAHYLGEGKDKVVMDIYIMSHCPYGLQMQKAVIPVAKLFKDVDSVEINNKFVSYVMHGQQEVDDNLVQYCIEQNYPDKLWDYLECFVEAGEADQCMASMGIDKDKITQCSQDAVTQFNIQGTDFPIYEDENVLYSVRGSPSVVLNAAPASMPRNAESIKQTICMYLKDKPAECDVDLSNYGTAAPSFGPVATDGSSSDTGAVCR